MAAPTVSVIMPACNAERFVDQAVRSIRNQSFSAFEFIAVDDGSTDRTAEILSWHAADDARIRILSQPHSGLVRSLNRALEAASGRLIARMDADDVAKPHRLQRQLEVLSAHPAAAAIGSGYEVLDQEGATLRVESVPTSPAAIREMLMRKNCIAHPTVLMRRDLVLAIGGYRGAFLRAEDYDLWLRLAERHDLLNLVEPLLCYREHPGQVAWRDIEQRVLSELGAQVSARYRRAGRPDPAAPLEIVTRDFLRAHGVDDQAISREMTGRAVGAARHAMRAGNRRAARDAVALALRQRHIRGTTRLRCWLMRARTYF